MSDQIIKGKKIKDLPIAASLNDTDDVVLEDTPAAGVKAVAKRFKLSTLLAWISNKLIVNSLTTTEAGYALDAKQGKALDTKIAGINSTLANVNADLTTLRTSLQGFIVQSKTYIDINVDGSTFTGSTDITYLRIEAPGLNRVICIGFATSSTNGEVWGNYINTNKILIQKGLDGTWTDFTSV